MFSITKEQANFLREKIDDVRITVVNKQHSRKKKRFVEETNNVKSLLEYYFAEEEKRIIEKH